jgi:NAD(P)-dependent dehydrogenase (short-subunit alcohol dehydrogenase family)
MGKLQGKVAVVTGGTTGIGFATAKRFVDEGAHVFITGRRDRELAAAAKEISRNVTGVQGDVSSLADLDSLFSQIKREKGKLDIVFANAGVAKYAPFGEITEELYDSTFDINVFTVQKALPLCRMALPSSSMHPSSAAKGCRRTAFTARPKPPCAPSRGLGRRI